MSRKLDDLDPEFQPIAFEFLARLTEAGIVVLIVTTSRTPEEQQDAVNRGVSWTLNSKHLKVGGRGSFAIDVCPYETYTLALGGDKLQWDASDPVWRKIGAIAVECGLKWGVVMNGIRKDPGHVEYVKPVGPLGGPVI